MSINTIAALEHGALMLTVNQRSAIFQRHRYNLDQREKGRQCWLTAQVYFISDWVSQTYRDWWRQSTDTVLNSFQSRTLWQQIIDESPHGNGLLNVASTARAAMQAWRLLQQWQVPVNRLANYTQLDVNAFYGWARAFDQRCGENGWIDEVQLTGRVATLVLDQNVTVPQHVLLLGFDELTPVQRHLIDALRQRGCDVDQVTSVSRVRQVKRCSCTDEVQEWRSAAVWARQCMAQSPDARIAVVVHDLSRVRDRVGRIFDDVLTPAATAGQCRPGSRPYNLSLGQSLGQTPLGAAALVLLECMEGDMDVARLGRLLVSPFIVAASTEYTARAKLDLNLRRRGEERLSLSRLKSIAVAGCPRLAQRLAVLAEAQGGFGRPRSPGAWATAMEHWLTTWGWPGQREIDSEEYQLVEAWRELMGRFAGLDTVIGECALGRALSLLSQMAREQVFQARSAETRLHIIGTLEAAGLAFDAVWVAGWHDETWPAPPQPNPFLPIDLQRRLAMPHASAERELDFARQLTARIVDAAPRVVISYPCLDGDRELRPSPLIRDIPEITLAELALPEPLRYRDVIFADGDMDTFCDWQAPALATGSAVAGGSGVFRDQAACPFRAFARYRLGAEGVPPLEAGLSAAGRGILIHRVLEVLWQVLGDSKSLQDMDEHALQDLVQQQVQQVVAREAARAPQLFTEKFALLERWRLSAMTLDWLRLERQRPPFDVEGLETKHRVELAGLVFDIKADRIDRLADGSLMIVDYKTGRPRVADWFGARPDQPQLPLYGVTQSEPVAAVAFAHVSREGGRFHGLGQGAALPDGVEDFAQSKYAWGNAAWQDCRLEWLGVLQGLADDFRRGVAVVDPKAGAATCQYCEIAPLCRINELNGLGLEARRDD